MTHRRRDPHARRAVPGARDAEPDRAGGHLPAARGAERPLHVQGPRDYPDRAEEKEILKRVGLGELPVLAAAGDARTTCSRRAKRSRSVYVDDKIQEYVLDLVSATRAPERLRARRSRTLIALRRLAARHAVPGARRAGAGADRGPRPTCCPRTSRRSRPTCCATASSVTYEAEAEGVDGEEDRAPRSSSRCACPDADRPSCCARSAVSRSAAAASSRTCSPAQSESVFKGRGMEFEEVRPYVPGDEVRDIDWNVTARLGQPYVKRFVEERELTVMLVVDVSRSMWFGTAAARAKRELAAELCAMLGFAAMREQRPRVGLLLAAGDGRALRAAGARSHASAAHAARRARHRAGLPAAPTSARPPRFVLRTRSRGAKPRVLDLGFRGRARRPRLARACAAATSSPRSLLRDPRDEQLPNVGWVMLEDLETGLRRAGRHRARADAPCLSRGGP